MFLKLCDKFSVLFKSCCMKGFCPHFQLWQQLNRSCSIFYYSCRRWRGWVWTLLCVSTVAAIFNVCNHEKATQEQQQTNTASLDCHISQRLSTFKFLMTFLDSLRFITSLLILVSPAEALSLCSATNFHTSDANSEQQTKKLIWR